MKILFDEAHRFGLEQIISKIPFSFRYGGRSSDDFLPSWEMAPEAKKLDDVKTLHIIRRTDPQTHLEVVSEFTAFSDFSAVEWVLYFKNTGNVDTPILENIQALDTNFTRNGDGEFVLHHMRGSLAERSDFTPLQDILIASSHKKFFCVGGRSSNGGDLTRKDGSFPFFNLVFDNGGIIFAVGWSGQWNAEFERDKDKSLNVTAGMELTHLKLLPGEEIRTPRILMFFWDGKRVDAHNDFRRFILKHHTPLKNDKPVTCPIAAFTWWQFNCGGGVTEENQIRIIRQIEQLGIKIDSYWIDAGWFESPDNWVRGAGNWFPKKEAFPNGLKPVAAEAKKHGMGFVLWFEPERVYPGTWLFEKHPEWLIMPTKRMIQQNNLPSYEISALFNLGIPQALSWLIEHISSFIKETGITIYRQDFNMDPLNYWRSADDQDRQGISEIRHIEGLYAFWDELLRRHPGLIIDNCASGGRRIDLETISRSVALWRTDYLYVPEGHQCHTLGISQYIPCTAAGSNAADAYTFRSGLSNGMSLEWDVEAKDFNAEAARQRVKEFKLLRPLFHGDFYALTVHNLAPDVWCAYQLDRKELNFGAVLVFRRKESPYSVACFKLQGLDSKRKYELTDIDSGVKNEFTGKELMEAGIEIKMFTAPGSALITYNQVRK